MNKYNFSKALSNNSACLLKKTHYAVNIMLCLILSALFLSGCAAKTEKRSLIAEINGKPVYLDELEMLGRMATQKQGLNFDSTEGQEHYHSITPNLYKTLITIYVLKFTAEEEGVTPSPEELDAEFVRYKDTLDKQGGYKQFLHNMGVTEDKFRQSIKDHMSIKLLEKQKLVDADVEVTEQDIRDYYNKNKKIFSYPLRMRASHIFVKSAKSDGQEKRQQARVRAEQLLKMIGDQPAKTFVGLARENSDDTATVARGGDIGFFDRTGPGSEQFKKAAFALKEGQLSDIVETDAGFHIIWATDHEQSLEEAHATVKEMQIRHKKAEYFAIWLEEATEKIDIKKYFNTETLEISQEEIK